MFTRLGVLIGSLAVALTLPALPASADPPYLNPQSSAMATQLSLHAGVGVLVVQARIGRDDMTGFEVSIPAGDGLWSGAADVAVPSLGAHCRDVGTAISPLPATWAHSVPVTNTGGLLYVCSAPSGLPLGSYQVSLPVRRVGGLVGVIGQISIVRPILGIPHLTVSDTFPVVPDTHFHSTAEARDFDTTSAGTIGRQYGDLAEIVTIVPGERVTAIDTVLPTPVGATWRPTGVTGLMPPTAPLLTRSLFDAHSLGGLTCRALPAFDEQVRVRCQDPQLGTNVPISTSRFLLVLKLSVAGVVGRPPATGSIALTVNGVIPESQDTFAWRQNLNN